MLGTLEFVIDESGYKIYLSIHRHGPRNSIHRLYEKMRARHEMLNNRLKYFNVLKAAFCHDVGLQETSSISYKSHIFIA